MAHRGGRSDHFRGEKGGIRGGKGKFDKKHKFPKKQKTWQIVEAEIGVLQEQYSEVRGVLDRDMNTHVDVD